jgi:hypothetical protein
MSYRVLVLRDHHAISLPVLRKVQQLVEDGATVVGPKPTGAMSLADSDAEVQEIASALWDSDRVVTDKTARQILINRGVKCDFECEPNREDTDIDYIHRRYDGADIYFIANRSEHADAVTCVFRVTGKAPELWDPISGRHTFATAYSEEDGRTSVPLDFAPCGSWFVVFRESANRHTATAKSNARRLTNLSELKGSWQVTFDPKWGGPGSVKLDSLVSWPQCEEPGIKFYSGTAIYRKTFDWPPQTQSSVEEGDLWLDLGNVRELAEVKLNGRSCGIVWSPPFQVDISDAVTPGENRLEIEVVNFWPNRIIGDAALPPEQQLTRTNIRQLTRDTELMPSGLFGPVTLQVVE